MTASPIDSDPEPAARRRRVCQLHLRGMSARRMGRVLQCPEAVIHDELAALLGEWTEEYGSVEIGECLASYRMIDELGMRYADRPGLSSHERCGFVRVALTASARECALRTRLGSSRRSAGVMVTGTEIREYIDAVRRGLREGDTPPVTQQGAALKERQSEVERLLARDRSRPAIECHLGLPGPTITEIIATVEAQWIAVFGTIEGGKTVARYRDLAERMLDLAVHSSHAPRDRRQYLNTALGARDRHLAALKELGCLDTARRTRLEPQPTEELLAAIRSWDDSV